MLRADPRIGGVFSSRNILLAGVGFLFAWLLLLPVAPAQAALAGFLLAAGGWLWLTHRGQLQDLRIERHHRPRVFENDPLTVTLRVVRGRGWPVQMLEIEDQFGASLQIAQRHLVPGLHEGWEVLIHYPVVAERHRGLYLIGPVNVRAADPFGIFHEQRQIETLTRLTVYPRAQPLGEYTIPGPEAAPGPSLDVAARLGQGDEILTVREYRPGDPPARIHWRTSARRGALHVMQLNRTVQAELAVYIDLSRRARYGLGGEATTELAITAATSILTRAHEARHRVSLAYAQREPVFFPPGSGLAHLHLLLDRLAIVEPGGETDFWRHIVPRALELPAGSRAVLIVTAGVMPFEAAREMVRRLVARQVGVDLVLIDEEGFIRIYKDQEVDLRRGQPGFAELVEALSQSGARVFPLRRGAAELPPHPVAAAARPDWSRRGAA